jgi:uncharacterized protein (TIGR03437 family)
MMGAEEVPMSRIWCVALIAIGQAAGWGQTDAAAPIFLGRTAMVLPPAAGGANLLFGSSLDPQGVTQPVIDVYVAGIDGTGARRLTQFGGESLTLSGVTAVTVSPDGGRAAFTAVPGIGRPEEIHVIDVASAADRTVSVYTEGCPQLAACINCFSACVHTPHLADNGALVLYSVSAQKPFFTVKTDGTGLTRLPIYSGALALGPQRVISRSGAVVFSSSAPFGPTFAAAPMDVYVMNLDGTNIRQVTKLGTDASLYALNATISADGATITFESNRDPVSGAAGTAELLYLISTAGTGLRAIGEGSSPTLSGDGTRAAFVRDGQIWVATGAGSQRVTSFKSSVAQDPVIAEDGSHVVFSLRSTTGAPAAIYAVNSDGGNLHAVYAPRSLNLRGISGGAPGAPPSSGSLITATGTNLAADGGVRAEQFPLPETLAGVSLLVNGTPLPLVAVDPWQVTAQLPQEQPEGAAAFQLLFSDGAQPAPVAADVSSFAPGIYAGADCQAFYHAGTAQLADDAHPAVAGEEVVSFWTGLGRTDPWLQAGLPAPVSPLARSAQPELRIGGQPATVTFAGLAPGFAGLYQVNVVVPAGLKPGRQSVSWPGNPAPLVGGLCAAISVR